MRAKDIHRACEDELGRPVSWFDGQDLPLRSLRPGARPRFQRVGQGLYGSVVIRMNEKPA